MTFVWVKFHFVLDLPLLQSVKVALQLNGFCKCMVILEQRPSSAKRLSVRGKVLVDIINLDEKKKGA